MRLGLLLAALLLVSSPPSTLAAGTDDAAVKFVLDSYKKALERRDLTGIERLFAEENEVIESGKIEGTYADYRDHHIWPELGHFESFQFSDYVVKVRLEGPIALATETYRYTIRLKDKPEPIERQGVATSVLRKSDGEWRIVSMHSSSRTPKPPKK
jgi:uncharacterized protein (TIGR02246 family)